MVEQSNTEQGTKEMKENEEPKAISMAEDLKNNKPSSQRKAKIGDGSHIAAEDR
jgi:hypothetical protein